MAIPWIKRLGIKNVEEHTPDTFKEERIGTLTFPEKLTDENAFKLANTVPEIYFPIDFHADRASKIRYMITKNGEEVTTKDIQRFVTDGINPLVPFSDLVYQAVFCYLADGNMIGYRGVPTIYQKASPSNISRIDILKPTDLELNEWNNVSMLDMSTMNAIIRRAKYLKVNGATQDLTIDNLVISCIDSVKRDDSAILSRSPLYKAIRPINNLLATYSARYNVYVNNGYAGILTRKVSGSGAQDLKEAVRPQDRNKIAEELNSHSGLTGNRNRFGINGITGVPVEFINTLATIKDLMPFEETLEDSVKIGSIYQLPAGLMPRKDQPTFDNQKEQERQVWENAIMSICETFAQFWTRACMLDTIGCEVTPDYSTVSCLQINREQLEDMTTKRLDNLKRIKELNPDADITKEVDLILEEYGKG
jgi:hypothetical protein